MEKQKHILKPNQRVKLKDGMDHFYAHARVGAEGIVRAVDHDHLGFPHALIEWDENHWTYEGEQNGWTFQTHFEPVEGSMSEEKGEKKSLDPKKVAEIVAAVYAAMENADENDLLEESPATVEMEMRGEFINAVERSVALLEQSEALLVIAVHRHDTDDGPTLVPETVTFSQTDEGRLAVEAQLAQLLLMSHSILVMDRLKQINQARAKEAE